MKVLRLTAIVSLAVLFWDAGQKFLKSLAFEARFAPGAAAADLHGTG